MSPIVDGLIFSKKTRGSGRRQATWKEQLEQILENVKHLGIVREP